jgi:hypothetical protein
VDVQREGRSLPGCARAGGGASTEAAEAYGVRHNHPQPTNMAWLTQTLRGLYHSGYTSMQLSKPALLERRDRIKAAARERKRRQRKKEREPPEAE